MRYLVSVLIVIVAISFASSATVYGQGTVTTLPVIKKSTGQGWRVADEKEYTAILEYIRKIAKLGKYKVHIPNNDNIAQAWVYEPTVDQAIVHHPEREDWVKDPRPTYGGVLVHFKKGYIGWAGFNAPEGLDYLRIPDKEGSQCVAYGVREWSWRSGFPFFTSEFITDGNIGVLNWKVSVTHEIIVEHDPYASQLKAAESSPELYGFLQTLQKVNWKRK